MAEDPEKSVTIRELLDTIRSIRDALRSHKNPTTEIHEVIAELSQIERQFGEGLLPVTPLRSALGIVAQLEYTPWRVAMVVEDVHRIWSILGML